MVALLSASPPGGQNSLRFFLDPAGLICSVCDLYWPLLTFRSSPAAAGSRGVALGVIPTSGQWWRTTSCRHTREISLEFWHQCVAVSSLFVSTIAQWKGLETTTQLVKKCKKGKKTTLGKTRGGVWASKTSEHGKKVKTNTAEPRLDFRRRRVDETMMSATRQQNKPAVSDASVKTARKTRRRRKEVWMLSDRAAAD